MDAPIGVKNGRLALFPERSQASAVLAPPPCAAVIRGGLRHTLLPLGLSLLEKAGVARRGAFVLVLDNDRTSVACMLAAMELRCVCVLVGKGRISLLPHVLQQTGLTKIITVEGDGKVSSTGTRQERAQVNWVDDNALDAGGVCMLTSGSVGEPKVVACSWDRMLLQGTSTNEQLFPNGPARVICATSISHAYSINAIFALLTSPFDQDSELCFASGTQALGDLLSAKCNKVTILHGTPATYTRLLQLPTKRLYVDVPYCAGTRLSRELFQMTLDHSGLEIMQNYGSTETGNIAAWHLLGATFEDESKHMEADARSYVGNLWPGVRVQIEEDGEVLVWTPWQSLGYVIDSNLYLANGAPHRTADRGVDARIGEDMTQLRLSGRIRPTITIKMDNGRPLLVQPDRIETLFKTKTGVTDALALMQDPSTRHTSFQVRVVLRASSKLTAVDLGHWAAAELSIPSTAIEVCVVEFLPCSPAGKLMYR